MARGDCHPLRFCYTWKHWGKRYQAEKAMKIALILFYIALIFPVSAPTAAADNGLPEPPSATAETGPALFTTAELDDLLAPIALYPDPLIAQILPAATFIDQVDEAARYVRQYGRSARIDYQSWDVSVRAIAHYPDVLFMMDRRYDWTVSLGQAYLSQPQEVMDAIQRLRAEAQAMGNLASTPQQQVVIEDDYIQIVPAQPDVIYVPLYDPMVVYVEPPYPAAYGFIRFGAGFTIGAWLNRDCDWHRHRVYYHGWRGGGWIGRARPHIRDRRNVYINSRYATIDINRRVDRINTQRFRNQIRRDVRMREIRPGQPPPRRAPQHGGPLTRPAPSPEPPRQAVSPPAPPGPQSPGSDTGEAHRGREPRSAPYPGFGGYGTARDVEINRERGESSRQSIRQYHPVRSQPAAPRPGFTGGRQTAPRSVTSPAPRPTPAGRPRDGGMGQRLR